MPGNLRHMANYLSKFRKYVNLKHEWKTVTHGLVLAITLKRKNNQTQGASNHYVARVTGETDVMTHG